jgi:hypothetical protein
MKSLGRDTRLLSRREKRRNKTGAVKRGSEVAV